MTIRIDNGYGIIAGDCHLNAFSSGTVRPKILPESTTYIEFDWIPAIASNGISFRKNKGADSACTPFDHQVFSIDGYIEKSVDMSTRPKHPNTVELCNTPQAKEPIYRVLCQKRHTTMGVTNMSGAHAIDFYTCAYGISVTHCSL